MTQLGLLGDVHGDWNWTRSAINTFDAAGIKEIHQLGDFGLYPTNAGYKFLHRVSLLLANLDMKMYITLGNHEHWPHALKLLEGASGWTEVAQSVFIAPRGYRWEQDGIRFMSLSGAPSVDRAWRVEDQKDVFLQDYHTWFPEEVITWEEVDTISAEGTVDVVFAHDLPEGVSGIDRIIAGNPHGFGAADLLYAADGRRRVTEVFNAVKPLVWAHGHYHHGNIEDIRVPWDFQSGEGFCRVTSFGCNGQNFSLGMIDTEHIDQVSLWNLAKPAVDSSFILR